jgi:type 1 fimbria pilin
VKQQVTLAWKPPASKAGGTIVGYQINDSQGLAVTVAATARSHIVKGLSKNGKYKFTVSAVRKPGQQKAVGPPSAPKTVTIS